MPTNLTRTPNGVQMEPDIYCVVLTTGVTTSAGDLSKRIGFAECGAIVTFEGIVRASEHSRKLMALDYEHHPIMAETQLRRVCTAALEKFDIEQVACEHCTGRVEVGSPSVAIAIGANHRGPAFQACQYILDELKIIVPIWKTPLYRNSLSTA